jgi:hypothetical protein
MGCVPIHLIRQKVGEILLFWEKVLGFWRREDGFPLPVFTEPVLMKMGIQVLRESQREEFP